MKPHHIFFLVIGGAVLLAAIFGGRQLSSNPPTFATYDILSMGEGDVGDHVKPSYIFVIRRSSVPQADPQMIFVPRDQVWHDKALPLGTLVSEKILNGVWVSRNVVVGCNPPHYIGSLLVSPTTRPVLPIPR